MTLGTSTVEKSSWRESVSGKVQSERLPRPLSMSGSAERQQSCLGNATRRIVQLSDRARVRLTTTSARTHARRHQALPERWRKPRTDRCTPTSADWSQFVCGVKCDCRIRRSRWSRITTSNSVPKRASRAPCVQRPTPTASRRPSESAHVCGVASNCERLRKPADERPHDRCVMHRAAHTDQSAWLNASRAVMAELLRCEKVCYLRWVSLAVSARVIIAWHVRRPTTLEAYSSVHHGRGA